MTKGRSRKAGRKKSAHRESEVRVYSPEDKAMFLLNSASTEAEYEEARREVKAMGLNPDRINHQPPTQIEFRGNDVIIHEPLASEVRACCLEARITVQQFWRRYVMTAVRKDLNALKRAARLQQVGKTKQQKART